MSAFLTLEHIPQILAKAAEKVAGMFNQRFTNIEERLKALEEIKTAPAHTPEVASLDEINAAIAEITGEFTTEQLAAAEAIELPAPAAPAEPTTPEPAAEEDIFARAARAKAEKEAKDEAWKQAKYKAYTALNTALNTALDERHLAFDYQAQYFDQTTERSYGAIGYMVHRVATGRATVNEMIDLALSEPGWTYKVHVAARIHRQMIAEFQRRGLYLYQNDGPEADAQDIQTPLGKMIEAKFAEIDADSLRQPLSDDVVAKRKQDYLDEIVKAAVDAGWAVPDRRRNKLEDACEDDEANNTGNGVVTDNHHVILGQEPSGQPGPANMSHRRTTKRNDSADEGGKSNTRKGGRRQ